MRPGTDHYANISVSSMPPRLAGKSMLVIMHGGQVAARWPRQIVQWQLLVTGYGRLRCHDAVQMYASS